MSWPGCIPDNSGTHLKVTATAVQAVQEAVLKGPVSPIEAYSCDLHILHAVQGSQQVACMTLEDWHEAQEVDPVLILVITRLQDEMLGQGQSKATDPLEVGQYRWECNHLLLKQGILYRWARPRGSEETFLQLVLPAAQREVVLRGCNEEVGHLGLEHMLNLMCDRLFWPHTAAQAQEHIGKCHLCLAFKARQPKALLENIVATHPLELVHLNYLCLEPGKGLDWNVLVVTDHFTRYAQVYVIRTQTAQMTAKTLWDMFIVHYGLPKKILMDQGKNFESQLVADLCELMGMKKIQTSPYHLQTNGQCERFNSTLINMLGTLPKEKKSSGKATLEHWFTPIISPKIQLQGSALLPQAWETTSPSSTCNTWFGTMYHHRAKHFEICSEDEGICQVGSKKS